MICDKCQKALSVGEFPFCPHGVGTYTHIPDECDFTTEHGWKTPRRFRSKSEWRRAQKEAGIVHAPRYSPLPGSDKVRTGGMSNWGAFVDLSPGKLAWLADRLATGHGTKEPELPKLRIRPDVHELTDAEYEVLRAR